MCCRDEVRWRHWADDWLLCLLAPNVYRSPMEALEAYEHIVQEGNYGQVEGLVTKYVGAFTMFFFSKLLKIWFVFYSRRVNVWLPFSVAIVLV